MSGRVVHFEMPYDDKDRATTFYREAFGWRVEEMPGFDYSFVTTGPAGDDGAASEPGYIGGGMTPREDPVTGPVITIDTDDVTAALERVVELGGSVIQERTPVGDMGFTGYFRDTEGTVVGLWESAPRA